MNLSLNNKIAVICGSTQGIGLAAAKEIAALGATCILLARNESKLKETVRQLDTSQQQDHFYAVADFANPDEVKNAIDKIIQQTYVNILVNNTGGPAGGPILQADITAFEMAFDQHVVCNQILAQAVVPGMKESGYGRIINVISTSVKTPLKNLGVSNTVRWAVAAWAKTLAGELAPFGITVNNVLPGATMTGRLRSLFETAAQAQNISYEQVEKSWLTKIPMGRFADAHEIAAMIAFLASPAAGYITGVNIQVDGGQTPVG